jgi:RNAse (barnase) inhibitor barstar
MSGLARLLARHVPPGVYRWTSTQPSTDLQHTVEHAHWRCVILDTWGVDDKAGFLDACAESFRFPDWFGRNFDALADCLTDVRPGADQSGVVVVWQGWAPLARADRTAFDVAVDVFGSRVDDERGGDFAVILQGAGPDDVEIAELDPHPTR